MDDIVKAALLKWPNVPDCRGWLGLDARGNWYLRDATAQAAGDFPASKGSLIEHQRLREFIERNYAGDADGRWFFQNGPQRVYVELEAAPWVWRLRGEGDETTVHSHTGRLGHVDTAWLDEQGRLFLGTDIGLGLVHTLDMEFAARVVESGAWEPVAVRFDALPERFGYRLTPAAAAR
jgi:hypothetical protein